MPRGSSHSDKHYVALISIDHFRHPSKMIDILILLVLVSPLSIPPLPFTELHIKDTNVAFFCAKHNKSLASEVEVIGFRLGMSWVTARMLFMKGFLECLEDFEVNKGMMVSQEICPKFADVLRRLQLWCSTFYQIPQVRPHSFLGISIKLQQPTCKGSFGVKAPGLQAESA